MTKNNSPGGAAASSEKLMAHELEKCRTEVDKRLAAFFTEGGSHAVLHESMRYSLLAGGKRIRAVICLKFCEAVCGSMEKAFDAACAIEMIHTYSLIHDDLPCMDDDDTRRGKPSNHIKYGEFTATLAGDALQAAAFETLLGSDLPAGSVVKMARVLAQAAGPNGICGGQYLDLAAGDKTITVNDLKEMHNMKTAVLIEAAARLGVIAAAGTARQESAAAEYAHLVGMAFQIRDDILDSAVGAEKNAENDEKTTFITLLGKKTCEDMIRANTDKAIKVIEDDFDQNSFLVWLAGMLAGREY